MVVEDLKKQLQAVSEENERLQKNLNSTRISNSRIVEELENQHSAEISTYRTKLSDAEDKIKRLESKKIQRDQEHLKSLVRGSNDGLGCSQSEFEYRFNKRRNLKKRLEASEEERRQLHDRLLHSQEAWESKVSTHNTALLAKHQQRIKHLEEFIEEQSITIKTLEQQLRNSLLEREKLAVLLSDHDQKFDEGGSENENFILRREMDNLLKEKIYLSNENSDLKKKLNNFEDNQFSSQNDERSHSLTAKTISQKDKSGTKEKDSLPSKPITEEDLELRNLFLSYFAKRYPKVVVTQLNRSTRL